MTYSRFIKKGTNMAANYVQHQEMVYLPRSGKHTFDEYMTFDLNLFTNNTSKQVVVAGLFNTIPCVWSLEGILFKRLNRKKYSFDFVY